MIDFSASDLLGRHVSGCAQDLSGRGLRQSAPRGIEADGVRWQELSQAEVDHLDATLVIDHDVGSFEIAVTDATACAATRASASGIANAKNFSASNPPGGMSSLRDDLPPTPCSGSDSHRTAPPRRW